MWVRFVGTAFDPTPKQLKTRPFQQTLRHIGKIMNSSRPPQRPLRAQLGHRRNRGQAGWLSAAGPLVIFGLGAGAMSHEEPCDRFLRG